MNIDRELIFTLLINGLGNIPSKVEGALFE